MRVIRPRLVALFMCSKTRHVSISLGRTLPALHSLYCALPLPHCTNNGDITVATSSRTETGNGGLVGRPSGTLDIVLTNCKNTGDINTINSAAGLVSLSNGGASSITLTNCSNTGDITTNYSANALVLASKDVTVVIDEASKNTGTITDSNK